MSTQPRSVEELKKEAQVIGLEGSQITEYILGQQQEDRNARAHCREIQRIELETTERDKARKHELEMARLRTSSPAAPTEVPISVEKPKLPMYKAGDDISSFIVRFERIAKMLLIPETTYAVRLCTVLSGKAMDVYASLSSEITEDYKRLKSALLTAFNKTPDGYRYEFKTAKIGSNETYEQFVSNLARKLDFWLESIPIEKTYDDLRSHLIYDQIISSVNHDLRLYLKERNPKSLQELTTLADNWSSARKSFRNFPKPTESKNEDSNPTSSNVSDHKPDVSKIKCHNCAKRGHYKANCPALPQTSTLTSEKKVNLCSSPTDSFTVQGTINGMSVPDIKYDTGYDCIIVSSSLLPDLDPESCRKTTLKIYLGRTDTFPICKVYIDCILYTGWTDAVIAPLSHASVLLGHVKGITDRVREFILKEPVSDNVNAVTRSQFQSGFPPSTTSSSLDLHVEPLKCKYEDFFKLQRECYILQKLHDKCVKNIVDEMKDGITFKYIYENNLLYRVCSKNNNKCLVVPKSLRNIVLVLAHESPLAGHFSHRKTQAKIFSNFYWPNASADIGYFVVLVKNARNFLLK